MYIRTLFDKRIRIHMHDEDDYEITDDKGVNIDLSTDQAMRVVDAITRHIPGYRPRRS